MRPTQPATLEELLTELASRAHGVITRAALFEAGVSRHVVDGLVRFRRLQPLHRGVYLHGALTGPLQPPRARVMAAVLACRRGTVVSHGSAGVLWGLVRSANGKGPVHVTVVGSDRGRRPGIRPHRVTFLHDDDVRSLDGIPVTAPARTLVDLASGLGPRELERAVATATRDGLVALPELRAALGRRSGATGAGVVRTLLGGPEHPAFTRSEAEDRFLQLVRRAGLSAPATNRRVRGLEVDFLWRREGVVVEVDGFTHHSSRPAFERDRARDARLAAAGLRVVRVTWRQLADEPLAVLARLAQTLGAARRGT